MPKNSKSLSRKYLKIIGIITLILGALTVITGIVVCCLKDVDYMGALSADMLKSIERLNWDNNTLRLFAGGTIAFGGIFSLIEGWLYVRAANDPAKSTLLLVLVVLTTISSVVTLFQGGFKDFGVVGGNVVALAINVLGLMAVMNARKEVK